MITSTPGSLLGVQCRLRYDATYFTILDILSLGPATGLVGLCEHWWETPCHTSMASTRSIMSLWQVSMPTATSLGDISEHFGQQLGNFNAISISLQTSPDKKFGMPPKLSLLGNARTKRGVEQLVQTLHEAANRLLRRASGSSDDLMYVFGINPRSATCVVGYRVQPRNSSFLDFCRRLERAHLTSIDLGAFEA